MIRKRGKLARGLISGEVAEGSDVSFTVQDDKLELTGEKAAARKRG